MDGVGGVNGQQTVTLMWLVSVAVPCGFLVDGDSVTREQLHPNTRGILAGAFHGKGRSGSGAATALVCTCWCRSRFPCGMSVWPWSRRGFQGGYSCKPARHTRSRSSLVHALCHPLPASQAPSPDAPLVQSKAFFSAIENPRRFQSTSYQSHSQSA